MSKTTPPPPSIGITARVEVFEIYPTPQFFNLDSAPPSPPSSPSSPIPEHINIFDIFENEGYNAFSKDGHVT